jgi:hypothetical protein
MQAPTPKQPDYSIVRQAEQTKKQVQDAAHAIAEKAKRDAEARRQREAAINARNRPTTRQR